MTTRIADAHLTAWRTFITTHATLIGVIEARLAAAERIPLHWYDVLIELAEAPERRLRMHELASSVVLSRSGLTRLVDKLAAAGLLTRQPDPSDRRGHFAVLTEAGLHALREAWPVYAEQIQTRFAAHLTEAEANQLTTLLKRMLESATS
jgi:DNA-binding MarR family transcriptional regulator